MSKRYTKEERREELKPADEIGAAAAARRLKIYVDTLYGWQGREKERGAALETAIGGRSKAELLEENRKMVEQTVKAHQGSIAFDSNTLHGLEVIISLPPQPHFS